MAPIAVTVFTGFLGMTARADLIKNTVLIRFCQVLEKRA